MISQQYLSQIEDPVQLSEAALAFSQAIAYPDLDIPHYLNLITSLSRRATQNIPENMPEADKATALARILFGPGGIRGNSTNYYDARNSFLNEVLDRKLGLPISLCVILIEVGNRMGLSFQGIGLPGHFIATINTGGRRLYIDPFHGGRLLNISDCKALVRQLGNLEMAFNPDWLRPVSHRDIIVRMLNNLRLVYMQEKNWTCTLRALELLQVTEPNKPSHMRDIGLINFKCGRRREAIYYLESYILRKYRAADLTPIRALLAELVQTEARLN